MRALTVVAATVFLLVATTATAHDRTWPGKKLGKALPQAKSFVQRVASLGPAQVAWVETALGEPIRSEDKAPTFYVGTGADGRSVGVVVFVDATGDNGKIEIGVALDPAGRLVNVVLYEHSERGVDDRAFLDQLTGKTAASKLKVGDDIQANDDSKHAAQAIASAAKRGALLAMAALGLGQKAGTP